MPPLYEYLCGTCGHQFDEVKQTGEYSLKSQCPHCDAVWADRLPSAASYRGNFGGGSTPKRPGAHRKQAK